MFTGNQDVLVEFARLAREYPAEPVENLWEQAGGTTTRAVDAPCAECGGEFLHKEGCSQELSFYETAHH